MSLQVLTCFVAIWDENSHSIVTFMGWTRLYWNILFTNEVKLPSLNYTLLIFTQKLWQFLNWAIIDVYAIHPSNLRSIFLSQLTKTSWNPTFSVCFWFSAVRQTEVLSLVISCFSVCHVIFSVCHVMSKLKNPVRQLLDGIVIKTFKKCQISVLWTKVVIKCWKVV